MISLKTKMKLTVTFAVFISAIMILFTGCPKTTDPAESNYTITFETNGGTQIASQTISAGETVTKPQDPVKDNYTFDGWYTDSNFTNKYDFGKSVYKKFTLYAKWKEIPAPVFYTVTFETNGGSSVSAQTVEAGKTLAQLPEAPAKNNFIFKGWYSDEGLTKTFSISTKITSDITIYAKWEQKKIFISFNTNGGSEVSSINILGEETITAPAAPVKEHYIFKGWFKDSELTNAFSFETDVEGITENTTVYAAWEIIRHTITFNVNGGSQIDAVTFDEGTSVKTPAAPTKTGYQFDGWYSDTALEQSFNVAKATVALTADITVYAKWKPNKYNATFVSNGGSRVSVQTVDYNTAITKPEDPVKTHYSFSGWYSDEDLTSPYDFANSVITQDIKLYAKWTIITHIITVNTDGGTVIPAIEINEGSSCDTPEVAKTGYTFAGWFADAEFTKDFDFVKDPPKLTADITVYAKWNINSYKVSFDSNQGTAVSAQTINYGQKVEKPAAPEKTGYTFAGWYTTAELTTAYNFTTEIITKDITLYAKWNINSYTVSFEPNGGSSVTAKTVVYDTTTTAPVAPTKTGYTFAGWYTTSGLTTAFNFTNTRITKDITLYAKWTINTYKVTFMLDDAVYSEADVLYLGVVEEPATPSNDAKVFDDWYIITTTTAVYDFTSAITDNITIYGKWQVIPQNKCYVTFKTDKNAIINQVLIDKNTAVAAPDPAPTQTGYTFLGWFNDDALWDFTTTISNTLILKQKWEANSLTPISVTLQQLDAEPDVNVDYDSDTKTFTASDSFAAYRWKLLANDAELTVLASSDTSSFVINTDDLAPGYYCVKLYVYDSSDTQFENPHEATAKVQVRKASVIQ